MVSLMTYGLANFLCLGVEPMNRIDSERSDLPDSKSSRQAGVRLETVDLILNDDMRTVPDLRRSVCGAHEQNRTVDLILTKDVLCQLSYMGPRIFLSGP